MRAMIAIVLVGAVGFTACSKGENAGAEEARKEAEREAKEKKAQGVEPAKKISPPVPGQAKLPCSQVIDVAAFQTALGEKDALSVRDGKEAETAAVCSLIRGGKKLSDTAQKSAIKQNGKLGVLPGDELCQVTLYCSVIENLDHFKAKCKERKDRDDDTMGSYACVQVVAVGADDVQVFRFLDDDTKCVIQVRGGPSNVNNDQIRACAKAARDTIGPEQIRVGAEAPAPAAAGSGSATSATP
jgi:hypothetical protein